MSSISSPVLKREIPRYLFIIFPLVVLSIVAMGYYYYLEEKETVIQNASRNLSTVADLKVNQIIQWRRERLSDANFIFTNENIARRITRLNQVPFPSLDFKQTHVWMSAMFNNGHYERMMLLDSSREKLIVLPPGNFSINPYLNVLLDSVRLTKKVLFSDIHLGVESLPELDLLVPILSEQDSSMVGTIILEVNPENFLYPILQSWPSASPTSETFLLRREGNAVLLLNQLRYLHQPPLTNSKPLTEFSLPAVHAVLGYQEIFEGTDYRGKQVLAATRIIPNSPWYLVTKTDREEIFEPLQKEFSLIALIELTLILFAGSLLGFIWRHNRAQLFRTLYEKETEKLALAKHYEYLTKHANDCIILYDDDDHIIEANERACETYQYTREEFLQKKLIELRDPETLPDFRQQLNKVKSENGNIFETSHIRKDGTTFPVEVSARPITINDSLFIQSIIRDISERKKTEEKIRKLNRLYATLSEINQTIVRVNDLEKLFPAICQIAVDYGKFRMAWLGKIDRETQIVKPVASAGTSDSYLDSIDISIMDIPTGKCPTGAAVRERRCIYTNDILNDPRMEPWRKEALQHGYRSSAAIPILDKGDIDYVFNFYAPEPNFFDWDELHLLEEIGTDISFAIERFRSKERQQRTEEALRTSEKKFKELFDNAPIGYHELDVHGNIVNINQTELEMLGYTREETVGKPVWEFIYDKESAHARVLAKLAGKLSSDTNTERAFVRSDGIIVSVLSDERILINEQGAITGLRTVIQDITTQKQTQLALRDSEERYRGLFEHMTEGYAYCKMLFEDGKAIDWIYVSVNDAFEKLTGLKNVMGKRVAEVIPGIHELDPELFNIYERVALNGKPEKFEIFVEVLKMWFSISVYSPEREFFVAVFDVITERKAAEEAMRTSEERYRLISNVASDYMFSTHLINENELKLEWVAGAFETLTGYTLAEYIAHGGWRACLHPDDIEVDNRDMKQLRENKKAVTEVRTIKKDGSILWVQVSAHPVWDETRNRLTGIYGAVKDITERKAAEEAMRESEERLRLALDAAEQGLYDLNVQTGEAKVNPQYASMLGYDPETFVETNQKWIERLHPDDREPVAAAYSAYINGELPEYKVEFRQRTNNGEWKWILSLGKIVQYDRDGKPLRMLGTHTDITERKIAEQLLKESERRYRDIFTFAPLGVYQATRDGKFIAVNARLVEILGYDSMDELKKVNLGQDVYYDPDEREQLIVKYEPVGYVPGIPVCWKKKNMTPVWISLTAHAVKDKLGKTLYFEGFIQDITERRLAEQSLRESEERYRLLVNTSPDPIFLHQEGQFIFVNPAGVKLLGAVTQEDLIGKPILDVIHPTYRNIVTERIQTASSEKKRVPVIEEKFLRLDGGVIDVEVSATGLTINGKPTMQVIARDITERKRTEDEIRKLRKAVEATDEVIFMTDREGTFVYVNPAFTRLYGYAPEEVVGKVTPRILKSGKVSPQEYEQFWKTLIDTKVIKAEIVNKTKNGRLVTIETNVNSITDEQNYIIGFLAIQSDITDRKQLEEQYYRAQRLESLGTLASGISHDLNNVLTPILLATEILKREFRGKHGLAVIETLEKSATRGKGIVQQILTFARGSQGERGVLQLKHIIREMEEIIHETFPKFISLKTEIDRGLLPISGDATQLHQVMMNLCVNARDAMPSGGALTVKAGNQVLDESFTRIHLGAKPGLYSVITIADTGIGMPDEVISKIFEPFFTTKEKGKGTGLGLATVHSIVKNHNGFVTVESAINKGTTFSVFLPAVELSQLSPTDLRYEDLPSGHGECILIVDDEASVRDITKQTLEMFGYTVMEAADGTDAISLYAKNQSNIDAVLTDIMMPIMDGYATIRALNRINPNLIVIAASGLATDHQIIETTAGKIDGFLQKPFTPTALLEILHKLLSKRSIPPIHPQPKN